jgi:hypothetical protein
VLRKDKSDYQRGYQKIRRYEEMGAESERVRAWVLVRAEQAPAAMQALYEELGHAGGDSYVVVRADIVDHEAYNAVVPVDAESEDALHEVVTMIEGHPGVKETVIVRVRAGAEGHIPYPPHTAHGYITEGEAGRAAIELGRPGRQGASPGYNPWG